MDKDLEGNTELDASRDNGRRGRIRFGVIKQDEPDIGDDKRLKLSKGKPAEWVVLEADGESKQENRLRIVSKIDTEGTSDVQEHSRKKRLRILRDFSSTNTFDTLQEQSEQEGLWYQQRNSNDCGPCMLLNIGSLLGIENEDESVTDVREWTNSKRREIIQRGGSIRELSPTDWFDNTDVDRYLSEKLGLDVQGIYISPHERDEIFEKIMQSMRSSFEIFYGTYGSHFRAVIPNEEVPGTYLMLDSFSDAPAVIGERELENFVHSNVYNTGRGGAGLNVGLVSDNKIEY